MSGPLAGTRVLVTRERPGRLAALLSERGADVVHVPLIGITDPSDGGAALRTALASLDRYDWLVVTSVAGAERVGDAAATHPDVHLAVVGAATADRLAELARRPVDLVPAVQHGDALAAALIERLDEPSVPILLAQAERATPVVERELRRAGHRVDVVAAYRTGHRRPAVADVADADAVLFASGSAAEAWFDAFGASSPPLPPTVVAIGPSTAAAASGMGLKVTAVAADHSVEGLVDELTRIVAAR